MSRVLLVDCMISAATPEHGRWLNSEGQATASITGEVFRLNESGKLLDTLDDYEGPEFERAIITASLHDGRVIDCWIYWYVGGASGRLIATGDWYNR